LSKICDEIALRLQREGGEITSNRRITEQRHHKNKSRPRAAFAQTSEPVYFDAAAAAASTAADAASTADDAAAAAAEAASATGAATAEAASMAAGATSSGFLPQADRATAAINDAIRSDLFIAYILSSKSRTQESNNYR
jgi:hypothetical protein